MDEQTTSCYTHARTNHLSPLLALSLCTLLFTGSAAAQTVMKLQDGIDMTEITATSVIINDNNNGENNGSLTTIDRNGYNQYNTANPVTPPTNKAVLGVQNIAGSVNGITANGNNVNLRGGTGGQTTLRLDDMGASFATLGVAPARVGGVAAGVLPNDAVNKRQLDDLSAQVNQFDGRITNLENRVEKIDKRMSAGIASTMAAVNIPQVDSDKTFAVGVGLGSYNSESALAVGASYRVADDAVLKASVASGSGSGSKAAFGIGAAMSW